MKLILRKYFPGALAIAFMATLCFATATAEAKTVSSANVEQLSSASSWKDCNETDRTSDLPLLRRGDYGPCVWYAQHLMQAHEVMIGTKYPDGIFGPGTLKGTKNFQTWFDVAGGADGIIGPNTWKELRKPYINPVL